MTLQVGNATSSTNRWRSALHRHRGHHLHLPGNRRQARKLIPLLDIISVGIYAATGADKALVYGFAPAVCIMMGFFTAVGGGMLR